MLPGNQKYAIFEKIVYKQHKLLSPYMEICSHIKFVLHNLCQTIMHSTELEKTHNISVTTSFFFIATVYGRTYKLLILKKILVHKNTDHPE